MKCYQINAKVQVTEIIDITEQKKIFGKLYKSEDWIALKDTETGYMWAKPTIFVKSAITSLLFSMFGRILFFLSLPFDLQAF